MVVLASQMSHRHTIAATTNGDTMKKQPYDDREDIEKLQAQWNKMNGIVRRKKEWSAAIVRAATAAEIAANIAIRKAFGSDSEFSTSFVDSLLSWANGIDGKFKRLLIPMTTDRERLKGLKALQKLAEKINKKRNTIVHRGSFSNEREALEMVDLAQQVIEGLVEPLEPGFTLSSRRSSKARPSGIRTRSRTG